MNIIPRISIKIIIRLNIFFLWRIYSGFLFPDFFAFCHIRMINMPAKEPPRDPVMSRTLKKAFLIFEFIITKVIINGMKQARMEEILFSSL